MKIIKKSNEQDGCSRREVPTKLVGNGVWMTGSVKGISRESADHWQLVLFFHLH